MTALGHAAAASMFRGHPVARILWGFVSHWLLDVMVDEYRPSDLYLTSVKTWRHPWVLWQVIGLAVFWIVTRDPWAIVYGLLPDIIEGIYIKAKLMMGEDVWISGKLLFPFHGLRQRFIYYPTELGTHVLEIAMVMMVVAYA